MKRRELLRSVPAVAAAPLVARRGATPGTALFEFSLAEWSLNRMIRGGTLDHLDFPAFARREFGLTAVEYVSTLFAKKGSDPAEIADLKRRCAEQGVRSLLIMVDREGDLGAADPAARALAVDNHHRWLHAATELGCHAIRVNARSEGSWQEQRDRAADGLRRLAELGDSHGIDVIVENHGGLSSNGSWLSEVMRLVDHPRCGTLPDFGNFLIKDDEWYDRYQGVAELMPFARAVSAKSNDFNEAGDESHTDYRRMMRIVLDAGYRGHVGIEYEGETLSEVEGVKATKKLLLRVRDELAPEYAARG